MISKKTFAWGMYDLANTIYSALFVTFFFPLYVKNYLGGTEFMVGAVFSASMLLVGLVVPALGALSDIVRKRMPFIIVFTALNCILVALVPSAGLKLALVLALLANVCYHAALNVYNALLPDVAQSEDRGSSSKNRSGRAGIGEVSGIGIAMGYVGTIVSLGVSYLVISYLGWGTRASLDAMFYTTSILFFGFASYTFINVTEPKRQVPHASFSGRMRAIIDRLKASVKDISRRKPLRSFLATTFFFTNSMNAVIIFLFLYGQQAFGLTERTFFPVYTLFAVGAALGAYFLSRQIDLRGPRAMLALAGWTWAAVILVLMGIGTSQKWGIDPYYLFIVAGTIGGAALGLVWASVRPLLITLVPRQRLGEYFGFLEMTSKFSGVLGPVVFGFLATYKGYGWAQFSLLIFFGIGLWFLKDVPSR